ncbi:glycoside hydrolase family 9 protein [Haliscomenobacter sp.]|uniref:glycoside hydrolase family 9 protein n=1 Tax=Haliscomenobacter sp. TaxID=2717303 RepID=UPI0035946250
MRASYLLLAFTLFCTSGATAQTVAIHLNQIGFYPTAPKIAVIAPSTSNTLFFVLDLTKGDTVFQGNLSAARPNSLSGKSSQIADFSSLQEDGKYQLYLADGTHSSSFVIAADVHRDLAQSVLKSYYFQRMSTALPATYAGAWARPFGHPDDKVLVHPSAASATRPAGYEISAPGGWYDAGDYNKYVVNSGITTSTLLSLYEDFPQYSQKLKTNIPESQNQLPDLLDEILWNLRWMLNMQDPNDGGVYHKLTNPSFDPMRIMPHEATKPRYVVKKTTTAALNLAAVAAQAARVLRPFQNQLPGLADSCLQVARKAWNWSIQNPNVLYQQNELNKSFDPDVVTGAYDDRSAADEWLWAATELFISTGEQQYQSRIEFKQALRVPTWNQVATLAALALARNAKVMPAKGRKSSKLAIQKLQKLADSLLMGLDQRPYHTVMGKSASDFVWGSSAVAANQAVVLLQAYRLNKKATYLQGALHNLDYLLGRNATGYCFVTGFGHKYPRHIHHRLSEADGVDEPVPGLLSGGPNPGKQDKCPGYPSDAPDECFIDDACSYASNEIAINWNAPMVYLAVAVEALAEQGAFKSKK